MFASTKDHHTIVNKILKQWLNRPRSHLSFRCLVFLILSTRFSTEIQGIVVDEKEEIRYMSRTKFRLYAWFNYRSPDNCELNNITMIQWSKTSPLFLWYHLAFRWTSRWDISANLISLYRAANNPLFSVCILFYTLLMVSEHSWEVYICSQTIYHIQFWICNVIKGLRKGRCAT